ncbi:hypothetical protein S7711_07176 [Stachybotrys chartarum IBT 7711]|uniref:trans-L-3-hydroxyproline dehydratase n=1 Tax=Stachybotrys chartarum (strain CBS 109288 / IBT 7711) TaxID=1280523 RepID=A0A084BAJ5_STACB|nr:hypothetical protein S7711_07176 [Stachybotrys chartarum IBT 7711]
MDLYQSLSNSAARQPIRCIDMHTTGEPTRIVLNGFPELRGTLNEQREEYRKQYDRYRRTTMLEPRGHDGMYGALLVRDSELIRSGEAHIAVLYLHNEGYSTICGHAAIALGRFLVDTHDLDNFPQRKDLIFDPVTSVTTVNLHTPCGINKLSVPSTNGGARSDPTRPVSFLSVPSFVGVLDMVVEIPEADWWPQLTATGRTSVRVDLSYGGAWYCMVNVDQLGFVGGLGKLNTKAFDAVTQIIKRQITSGDLVKQVAVPFDVEWYLYRIMIVDKSLGDDDGESGLCFFADQQIDRSPAGGCVASRMALAYARGHPLHQSVKFNSFISNEFGGRGAFTGTSVQEVEIAGGHGISSKGVVVRVEGQAFYTGAMTFIIEPEDHINDGFAVKDIEMASTR